MTPEALQRIEAALRLHMVVFGEQERADLRALLEERRWISVQEKLPDKIYEYLITDGEAVCIAYFDPHYGNWANDNIASNDVTHWMPLPAPPTTPSPEEAK